MTNYFQNALHVVLSMFTMLLALSAKHLNVIHFKSGKFHCYDISFGM